MAHEITRKLLADLQAGAMNAIGDSVDIYPETLLLLVRSARERAAMITAMEKILALSLDHGQFPVAEAQEIAREALKALKVKPHPEIAVEAEVGIV